MHAFQNTKHFEQLQIFVYKSGFGKVQILLTETATITLLTINVSLIVVLFIKPTKTLFRENPLQGKPFAGKTICRENHLHGKPFVGKTICSKIICREIYSQRKSFADLNIISHMHVTIWMLNSPVPFLRVLIAN